MKSRSIAIVIVLLILSALSQDRPKSVPVASAATIELQDFTIHSPSGQGWQMWRPHDTWEIKFENIALKADATATSGTLDNPPANVQEKLTQLAESVVKVFSQHGKLLLSEHALETRDGAECLYTRNIIDSPELTARGLHAGILAMHSFECIYGQNHERLATFAYVYPTQGTADPQQARAKEFFASLKFKVPQGK